MLSNHLHSLFIGRDDKILSHAWLEILGHGSHCWIFMCRQNFIMKENSFDLMFLFKIIKQFIYFYSLTEVMLFNWLCVCVHESPQCAPVESMVKAVPKRVCAPTMALVIPLTAPVSATQDGSVRTAPNVRRHQIIPFPLSHTLFSFSHLSTDWPHFFILQMRTKRNFFLGSVIHFLWLTSQTTGKKKKKLKHNYSTGSNINYPPYIE